MVGDKENNEINGLNFPLSSRFYCSIIIGIVVMPITVLSQRYVFVNRFSEEIKESYIYLVCENLKNWQKTTKMALEKIRGQNL